MPSMSPRTQQMQMAGGAGVDQAEQMFEKGFSDMAYNVLVSRFPDLMQDVVTFKILDTDLDKGMGVGAFVLMRNDQPLYVPVVMSDNNIKPIELVYHKPLNIFLPLTKAWLEELDKTSLGSLGKGIKTPETLYSDVDIRNIVVPPITGRFSYAEYVENPAKFDRATIVELLDKVASEPELMLIDFLGKASNAVKTAMAHVFEKNPRLLKHAASIYGVNALTEALRPRIELQKIAAKQHFGGGLWIADKDTTPTEFRRIFGDRAGEAYAGVRRKGYEAKDERLQHNLAVQEQPYDSYVEPNQPGVYVLYDVDGDERPAFVMPNPVDLFGEQSRYAPRPPVPGRNPLVNNSYYDPDPFGGSIKYYPDGRPDEGDYALKQPYTRYLAVLANGDYLLSQKLVGRSSVADAVSGGTLHERMFKSLAGEPRQGLGFFVRERGTTFQATEPVRIVSVTNTPDGGRRIKLESRGGFETKTAVTEPTNPYSRIWMPKDANIVYLPADFIWVPLKERLKEGDFFTSAHDLAGCASSALSAVGVKKVSIKNAGAGQFSVDGGPALDKIAALKKIATDYVLKVADVEVLLEKAATERRVQFWPASMQKLALAQERLEKRAADDDKKKSSGGDSKPKKKDPSAGAGASGAGGAPDMGADPMADPAAQAQMMAAMQPPEPPPPSPMELAGMEFQQHLDNELQKIIEKRQLIDALTQRSQEIASGAPPSASTQTAAMGAPPAQGLSAGMQMPPPGVGAAPLPGMGQPGMMGGADPMGGMQGMGGADPMGGMQGMGAQPPMGGGMPGMDPMMAGAAPGGSLPMAPGMDPSMSGDPSMGGMPQQPNAMMGPDGLSASALQSQINPQFLGNAAQLQSGDVFDAAAVSSLAQSPAVKELIGNYLPNLEKALDNLSRVLLSLWMQEPELKGEIGEAAFSDLEDNLRTTMKTMGDLVLRLSQGAHVIKGQFEHEEA